MGVLCIKIWNSLKLGHKDKPLYVAKSRAILCIVGIFALYTMGLGSSLIGATFFSSFTSQKAGGNTEITSDKARVDIYDRNDQILAKNLSLFSLVADPASMLSIDEAIQKTLTVFPDLDKERMRKLLNRKNSRYTLIKHGITPNQQVAINNLGIPGFYFEPYVGRFYPHRNLFSHVLGFVSAESKGLLGLERAFDEETGKKVRLSFDSRAQFILHEELQKTVRKYDAIGGSAIIMSVKTREVLAMVSLPDFDPHSNPNEIVLSSMFNRATQGIYEFGSSFKIFNSALSLQQGKSLTQDIYDASRPLYVGGGFRVRDYHAQNRELNIAEIFIHSSNIGSALMAWDNGADLQKQFLKDLGMLEKVDTNYPEIATPQFPTPWKKISVATISYGHGISVSPLHLTNAVATVIGSGRHKSPHFTLQEQAEEEVDDEGKELLSRQVILQMRGLFRLNVLEGSGRKANVLGYRVGGKTGTAEKINSSGTAYDRGRLISNFVATFPIEDPEYVIFVMVDEPKAINKRRPTGGVVAAPVVGRVIQRLAPILGLLPEVEKERIQDEELYLPLLQLEPEV